MSSRHYKDFKIFFFVGKYLLVQNEISKTFRYKILRLNSSLTKLLFKSFIE